MRVINYTRWAITELFFTMSVFSAVLFGTYALSIRLGNHLTDTNLSILSGVFFVVFALSQVCAGVLINKLSPKLLLSSSAFVSALGAFLFAHTTVFELLVVARIMLGLGLGCTFVGVLYVVQTNFSEHQFAFFSSLSQSIANIFAGMLALFAGKALSQYSYTYVFDILAVMFIICTIGLSILLPHKTRTTSDSDPQEPVISRMWSILSKRNFWLASFYFTGLFGSILTFADLYNVTYEMKVFGVPHDMAIMMNGLVPIGVSTGGVIAGFLVSRYQNNRLTAICFSLITLIFLCLIMYIRWPDRRFGFEIAFLFNFLYGVGCGGAMLAFQEIQLLFKQFSIRPLANSLVLTFAYLFNGIVIQPLTGYIIGETRVVHYFNQSSPYSRWLYDTGIHNEWHKFNSGLFIIVLIIVISFISSIFFTKKKSN
ncbi:MFS transporter [Francisella philomiragia]|uniref:MFS transporter n=1 Tax=Francisella philomiragia TaxID=28110 RepID=UPI001905B88A|nr:MFS transporter [Francisella philomiragia]MBK2297039.1 MFS transporter [Francisella philomiragia]MBK2341285.1 MFS transporter [Francisella philomiragia]